MTAAALVQAFLGNIFAGKMDEALSMVDPQAVFVSGNPRPNPSNPLHGTFVGQDGARDFFGGFGSLLEPGDFNVTAAFGDDHHAALYGTLRHKSRETGREFASDWALICQVRDERLVLYHFYEDTEALRAAIA
ncbi:nuclear transport factor 2 family protein [Croceibacterium sp. LX-88]|uniref:Nuclear transport factor 2 family protein n=1 Tax=Croceibacterium selenioxidans TaxID=2838833 RepID=A0ABS5W406_9SPHN|nr:nuclear transport factor 2 family protein [Croceibacterium selenioxidans]MBT2134492.1 nuclear transport factor 2 family protein [Croceibacterium selenioxidans]